MKFIIFPYFIFFILFYDRLVKPEKQISFKVESDVLCKLNSQLSTFYSVSLFFSGIHLFKVSSVSKDEEIIFLNFLIVITRIIEIFHYLLVRKN